MSLNLFHYMCAVWVSPTCGDDPRVYRSSCAERSDGILRAACGDPFDPFGSAFDSARSVDSDPHRPVHDYVSTTTTVPAAGALRDVTERAPGTVRQSPDGEMLSVFTERCNLTISKDINVSVPGP